MHNEERDDDDLREYSDCELRKALNDNDEGLLSKIVVSTALYHPDLHFTEELCLRLSNHENCTVRGNAVLGFGHLARRSGYLESSEAKATIESALTDASPYVRGQAWAAAEDLVQFLNCRVEGFDER